MTTQNRQKSNAKKYTQKTQASFGPDLILSLEEIPVLGKLFEYEEVDLGSQVMFGLDGIQVESLVV